MFGNHSKKSSGDKGCAFAKPEEELLVQERAKKWEYEDPFPEIEPALLSAVEIRNYARVTGMLHPYDDDKLKAASFPAGMGGTFVRWEDGNKIEKQVLDLDEIILPPNSISFVQTDVTFRLPHYVAMRFNLQISHVHRGLLLGTGPVVDPGFQGQLLIPLHNLTSTEYRISISEPLIWIEFTKTTFRRPVKERGYDSSGSEKFVFPEEKRFMTPDRYFRRANDLNPIESSLPKALKEMAADADRAATDAATARTAAVTSKDQSAKADAKLYRYGFVGLLAVIIGVVAIYLQAINVVQDAASSITSAEDVVLRAKSVGEANEKAVSEVKDLQRRLSELERRAGVPAVRPTKPAPPNAIQP